MEKNDTVAELLRRKLENCRFGDQPEHQLHVWPEKCPRCGASVDQVPPFQETDSKACAGCNYAVGTIACISPSPSFEEKAPPSSSSSSLSPTPAGGGPSPPDRQAMAERCQIDLIMAKTLREEFRAEFVRWARQPDSEERTNWLGKLQHSMHLTRVWTRELTLCLHLISTAEIPAGSVP